jgi:hypothetical protein
MPGKDRGRGDEPTGLQRSGEEPDQRGEQGSVRPVQARFRVLPAQYRVLMAQDEDLYVFGRAGPGEQGQPFGDAAKHKVDQAQRHTFMMMPEGVAAR